MPKFPTTPQGSPPPAGNQTPQPAGTCAPQYLCSGNSLMSRSNTCVDTSVQQCQYGCSGTACTAAPPQGGNCPAAPTQPDPSGCANGTFKPTYSGACVNNWQCVPTGTTPGPGTPTTAQISCNPQVADAGMSVTIAYSCPSGTSTGLGFSTGGAQSGTATVVVPNPPANTNSATFGLTCSTPASGNQPAQTSSAQCVVQVGKPSVVLIANPKTVDRGGASTLGWITTGMQSCVISSQDLPAFTAQNANNTSVNGTVTTPPLTSAARFLLHCTTLGGATRDANATVSITGVPDNFDGGGGGATPGGTVTASSTIDGTTAKHGDTATISWVSQDPPTGSAMSLWLFDVRLNQSTGLIAGAKPASGTYSWKLPDADEACPVDSPRVCATDLVVGRKYIIEAALYTPSNAFLGGFPPENPINPTYIDYGFGEEFTIGN